MDQSLSSLPAVVQGLIYVLVAVPIAIGSVVAYFRSAAKEKAAPAAGVILTGDSVQIKSLTDAITTMAQCIDRDCAGRDRSHQTMLLHYDATRDLREEMGKLRAVLLASQVSNMPRDEDLRRLVGEIDRVTSHLPKD